MHGYRRWVSTRCDVMGTGAFGSVRERASQAGADKAGRRRSSGGRTGDEGWTVGRRGMVLFFMISTDDDEGQRACNGHGRHACVTREQALCYHRWTEPGEEHACMHGKEGSCKIQP